MDRMSYKGSMLVQTALFYDVGTTAPQEMKRIEGEESLSNPICSMSKGDCVGFLDKALELKKYAIVGKELQETEAGIYALVFSLREVPKRA